MTAASILFKASLAFTHASSFTRLSSATQAGRLRRERGGRRLMGKVPLLLWPTSRHYGSSTARHHMNKPYRMPIAASQLKLCFVLGIFLSEVASRSAKESIAHIGFSNVTQPANDKDCTTKKPSPNQTLFVAWIKRMIIALRIPKIRMLSLETPHTRSILS